MRMAFGVICLQYQLHISSQISEICAQLACRINTLLSLDHSLSTLQWTESKSFGSLLIIGTRIILKWLVA